MYTHIHVHTYVDIDITKIQQAYVFNDTSLDKKHIIYQKQIFLIYSDTFIM